MYDIKFTQACRYKLKKNKLTLVDISRILSQLMINPYLKSREVVYYKNIRTYLLTKWKVEVLYTVRNKIVSILDINIIN